jgi:hypothetical protein
MRFVKEDVTRLPLSDGAWIDVKTELTVGEDRRFRVAGMKKTTVKGDVEISWEDFAFARANAYLVAWSATDERGKSIPVTEDAIRALDVASFEEIDAAIGAHVDAVTAGKKTTTAETSTSPEASA